MHRDGASNTILKYNPEAFSNVRQYFQFLLSAQMGKCHTAEAGNQLVESMYGWQTKNFFYIFKWLGEKFQNENYKIRISGPINKVLLEYSHAHLTYCQLLLCITLAELSSCGRDL